MRVLLSDGSGLTARQVANRLHAGGHRVEVLTPDPWCLCRFTRHVARLHRVPAFGPDPLAWLDAALGVYARGGFDMLMPTQEQVAVLAAFPARLAARGVRTAVPGFEALRAVQDKLSAFATLSRLGLPQPPSGITAEGWDQFPAYVKTAIGTASGGVRLVENADQLISAARGQAAVLVQAAIDGPLAMCQSVWQRGTMLAFHASLRVAEGAGGGASHKRSIALPAARAGLETLGAALGWHGALSADVILADRGPVFIDINPRLVEPENAWRAGTDLVGAMLHVAAGTPAIARATSAAGAPTHQLLLAILGTAQRGQGRRGVARELIAAARGRERYAASAEELTPITGDLLAGVPVTLAAAATLAWPASWRRFTAASVTNYALSPSGWQQILTAAEPANDHLIPDSGPTG